MLAKAIRIAAEAFENKKDKAGQPYILHCLRVMNQMDPMDEELKTIAVLHDLLEDCPEQYNTASLLNHGFSERVVHALILLTHNNDHLYDDYIKALSKNPDARKVKLADLRDNSDITRLKGLRQKDFERLEKYHRAYVYLAKMPNGKPSIFRLVTPQTKIKKTFELISKSPI